MAGGERRETGDHRFNKFMEGLRRCPPLVRSPEEFAPRRPGPERSAEAYQPRRRGLRQKGHASRRFPAQVQRPS
jgi:hypothetical protein